MPGFISGNIRISDIREDDTFRISRPVVSDALLQSIKELGLLEKPFLLDDGKGLLPVTCHNRILALKRHEADAVDAHVIKKIDPGIFTGNTAMKVRRNEVGPAGKCRALAISQEFSLYNDPALFCKKILNVSPDILDTEFASVILDLPRSLRNYIDIKDAGFKIIRDLVVLPRYMIDWLDGCVEMMQVRINVFKAVVEHLFDLGKKYEHLPLPVFIQGKSDDRHLLEAVRRLRFPEYSGLRDRADLIINAVSARGVSVDFPEFFESSRFVVNIDVDLRDSAADIRARLDAVDAGKLVELASLLK